MIGVLELDGRDHADLAVKSPVIEPVDVFRGRDLEVVDALLRALLADQLGLEQRVERLGQSVVVGVPDRPDRRGDVFEPQPLSQCNRCVLGGFNRSMQHRVVVVSVTVLQRLRRGSSSRGPFGDGC